MTLSEHWGREKLLILTESQRNPTWHDLAAFMWYELCWVVYRHRQFS